MARANAYVLSQKGRYKVTARAVDSNGVVTTPTVDGTESGEVTEDAVAETTYYIVVTDPEKSSGAQGQKQIDSIADNFNDGKEGTTVSDFKLVDPTTGNKVASVTTKRRNLHSRFNNRRSKFHSSRRLCRNSYTDKSFSKCNIQ